MNKSILVTYASKYGSTKEIAEKIGEVLQLHGQQVEVLPVGMVGDLNRFKAVILGSALYIGNWPKEAGKFLKANEKNLADRRLWVFSSGPVGEGDPLKLVDGKLVPSKLQATLDRILPRDVTVFHGNINVEKISPLEKWAIKKIVKKPLGDARDWNAITRWANQIAAAV